MEIGSIFEINPDDINFKKKEKSEIRLAEVEKYGKKQIRYMTSGREAITLAIKSYEKKYSLANRACLLPAYMCNSVFYTFKRAGWKVYFYHIDKNMLVDVDEIYEKVKYWKPSMIFVHPYYGVDTWSSARYLLKMFRAEGICILEDVTQSYYLSNVGLEADYIIGSLRKWYSIPDGGFVATDIDISDINLCIDETLAERKLEISFLKWKYLHKGGGQNYNLKNVFLRKNQEAENWLDGYSKMSEMSKYSVDLLTNIKEDNCKRRRHENFKILKSLIIQKEQIRFVFNEIDEKCFAPLYAAVYIQDRGKMQKYLSQKGIYAPALWPIGSENREYLNESEVYIFEHVLALPVDYRYEETDMQYVSDVINAFR